MDLHFFKKSRGTLLFLILFSLIVIPVMYYVLKQDEKLRVVNPVDVNPQLVDKSVRHVGKNHKIKDFKLTNQYGEIVTKNTFKNKIYVTDFFFTTCTTICPVMTDNMVKLQERFKNDDLVMFLSHSVTPDIDSVAVLKAYADKKGAIKDKWHLVTGDKKHIYDLARKSYFAAKSEGNGDEYDFVHTENFVLIDPKGRIRGAYDGTASEEIEKLIKDIAVLKNEVENAK